jgi:uncharacterized protein GlcG (DUF336 family)
MRNFCSAATVTVMLLLTPAAHLGAQALPQVPQLTLEASRRVVTAAQDHARAAGLRVVVTVVDAGGHVIIAERMDGTQIASVDIAAAKARSAEAFRRPTRELAGWVAGGDVGLMSLPGLMPVEGGIPVLDGPHVVGAVGVSGATARQDGEIAQAGVAALRGSSPPPPRELPR